MCRQSRNIDATLHVHQRHINKVSVGKLDVSSSKIAATASFCMIPVYKVKAYSIQAAIHVRSSLYLIHVACMRLIHALYSPADSNGLMVFCSLDIDSVLACSKRWVEVVMTGEAWNRAFAPSQCTILRAILVDGISLCEGLTCAGFHTCAQDHISVLPCTKTPRSQAALSCST